MKRLKGSYKGMAGTWAALRDKVSAANAWFTVVRTIQFMFASV